MKSQNHSYLALACLPQRQWMNYRTNRTLHLQSIHCSLRGKWIYQLKLLFIMLSIFSIYSSITKEIIQILRNFMVKLRAIFFYLLQQLVYKVARSQITQCSKFCDLQPSPNCSVQYVELRGYCHVQGGGATSQLDLPSLAPLSVAGCGRQQLGAPHWATSVNYSKQLIIEPTFCGSRFSTGRLLAMEDFTFLCHFFINIWVSVMKRNLSDYSHIIFYYYTRIYSKQKAFLYNEGFRTVLNNQLPLILSVTSHQFFFFIGLQNLFHLLTKYILALFIIQIRHILKA